MGFQTAQDIEALVDLFDRSDWRELRLVFDGVELFLSKDANARGSERQATNLDPMPIPVPALGDGGPISPDRAASVADQPVPIGWSVVHAPSLGTFYRAPKPGAPPFTDLGASVTEDSELCLIEVMKLFTTLRADTAGVVREIYATDGELVEFEQPLFLIEPHA